MQDIPPRPIPSGYDPTRNPLPPDAIRAPPGERQIAYPPEYPRAKIHATGTVHLGVRPRSVPTTTSTTVQGQEGRRPGYGELASEVPDRELPPDTRFSTTRPMSTRAADSVSVAVTRGDRKAATPIPTPTPLPATLIPTSISTSYDRQARPKMTLEQAVNEYDRTHPPSSAAATPSSSQHTRNDPPAGEAIKDDVRSHDGVYTYDYSTQPQQVGSHKGGGGGGGEGPGGKAHDEPNGLGPGRGYPEAPIRDDAYGVPFGKRLKAMIQLRRDAEDAGLVSVSSSSYSSEDVFGSGSGSGSSSLNDGMPRSGLLRRPATGGGGGGDGASHRNGAMQVQGSPRTNKGKAAERPASSADNGYPKNEADVCSPSTPRPLASQRNHPSQHPNPPRSERSTTTSASLSTATTTATTQAKIRRKPVPQYIEHSSSSSSIRTPTDSPLSVVRKQKSEPGIGGGDGGDFAARLERRERRKREKERERERRAGEDESRVLVVAGRKKHGRSRSEQPQTSSDTRSQRGIPGTDTKVVDDQYGMPLKGPFTRSPLQPSQGGHTAEISLASSQITMHGGLIVPPMPEGEEYDAETEAERQAAWEEYYRLQGVVGMYDDRGSGDGQETGYPQVEEWVDTQTPGFPYNVGAVPELATASPGKMPAVRPPLMGSMASPMGAPMGPMGTPMYPGQQQQHPMFYGFQHPGMMAPDHVMGGAEYGAMAMGAGAYEGEDMEYAPAQRHPGVPIAGPPARAKHLARPVPTFSDSRRDVRFAGVSEAPPKLATRHSGYTGWRYPAQQGAYMSHEHTPASSAMTSPTADSADPMEAYSPRGSYAHQGYYGYSPYPSYPNTPSVNSGAGYNAQSDPFNLEEMSNAVHQAAGPKQKSGEQSLQDRRKKSWYGPRQ